MKGWLTLAEAAQRVKRGESTVRRWIENGLPIVAGLVREDQLLAFEREQRLRRGRPKKVDPGAAVLAEVASERARQNAKWGEQNHPDGTGPDEQLPTVDAIYPELGEAAYVSLAERAKRQTDQAAGRDECTWALILLEEVFEALAESDVATLRMELVQVAAVAAQWAEAIDRRVA